MVGIVKIFGILNIIAAVILFCASLIQQSFLLFLLAASGLLGGALLIIFARIVELLEALNEKLSPVFTIASSLETKYRPAVAEDTNYPAYILDHPPAGARATKHNGRRVVILADGSVVGEMLNGGVRRFANLDDFRAFVGA